MMRVSKSKIPNSSLARRYLDKPKTRVDCFHIRSPNNVSLETFVGQFYRSPLFRTERAILKVATGYRSSDTQLEDLLAQEGKTFSAWTQVARNENQLIMSDYQNRTCSWFMVEADENGTDLYFGTVVQPTNYYKYGEWLSNPIFKALLPVHIIYARSLLAQTAKGLM